MNAGIFNRGVFDGSRFTGDVGEGDETKARFFHTLSDGYRSYNKGAPVKDVLEVEVDVYNWTAPDGTRMTLGMVIRCPQCEFPLLSGQLPQGTTIDSDGLLTLPVVITCPGHWAAVNGAGQHIGGRAKCDWRAIIRDGHAHNPGTVLPNGAPNPRDPGCPCANFRMTTSSNSAQCTCSGHLTPAQDADLRRRR